MRSLSARVLHAVVLLAMLVAPAFADDGNPYEPPDARIKPPIPDTSELRIKIPPGVTSEGRILPPIPGTDARIGPPGDVTSLEPSYAERFLNWLRATLRIAPPIG